MRIGNDEVLNVLGNSRVEGNKLFLSDGQLDRKLYLSVDKVLKALGGKWDRKAGCHLFDGDPADIVDEVLLTGEYTDRKKEFQFFETPSVLAEQLVKMADIQEGETVLEPSAGRGAIAQYLNGCDCVELETLNREYLQENGYNVVGDDFLTFDKKYDVIVANPPFSGQQDIDHVWRMVKMANHRVVSVMSASVLFRDNHKTVSFRSFMEGFGATIEPLPDGSFSSSGTMVRSCVFYADVGNTHERGGY